MTLKNHQETVKHAKLLDDFKRTNLRTVAFEERVEAETEGKTKLFTEVMIGDLPKLEKEMDTR